MLLFKYKYIPIICSLFKSSPRNTECDLLKPHFSLLGFFIGVSSGVLISTRTVKKEGQ